MGKIINSETLSGAFLLLLGLATALYANAHYDLGTIREMGPGMYPFVLGLLLAICGALIAGASVVGMVQSQALSVDFRALSMISAGVLAFAYLIDVVGLVGATFALIILSNLAAGGINLVRAIILAIAMSIVSVLIFGVGLGIPLQMFRWPL